MTGKQINIGMAGCGWIAQNAHIPAFRQLENVTIKSVFDISQERAKSTADKFSIENAFDNYDDFLNSEIDAVLICTPNNTHADLSIRAMQKGKHVLCEKPITIHAEDAKAIQKAAKETGKLFVPGFVNRFREDIKKMKEIISSGEIGEVTGLESGWRRRSGIPRPGTWFTCKELSGGGVLIDLGPHVIDISLMLLGDREFEEAEALMARNYEKTSEIGASWFNTGEEAKAGLDVEDTVTAKIKFKDGLKFDLSLSWLAPVKGDNTFFTVYGTRGVLELKTLFGFSTDRMWDPDHLTIKDLDGSVREICFDRQSNNATKAFEGLAKYFTDCVISQESDYLTSDDGYRTVRMIERLYGLGRYE